VPNSIALALWAVLHLTAAHAGTDVAVVGLFPGKAVLVINGGAPRTVSVGARTSDGVRLVSVDGEAATLEFDGGRHRIAIGERSVAAAGDTAAAPVTLNADGRGHFLTEGSINGAPVRFMVDTGATLVSLGAADAVRAGILAEHDLPDAVQRELGRSHAARINALVSDIVEASWAATGESARDREMPIIRFSPRVHAVANELREFMFRRVYLYESTRRDAERGKRLVTFLFHHFVASPEGVSGDYALPGDPVERRSADYVSGMTDRFAMRLGRELGCAEAAELWSSGT